jgi:hypothetical protein
VCRPGQPSDTPQAAPDLRNALNSGLTREQFISIALACFPDKGMPSWSKIFSRDDMESIYE